MMAAAVAILLVAFNAFAQTDSPGPALASGHALLRGSGQLTSPSPSHRPMGKRASLCNRFINPDSDATTIVTVRANDRSYKTQMGSWVNAELAWSPDSKAFFVTYSDGGNVGTYHVKVVYVDDTGLHMTEPVANGRRLFVPTCSIQSARTSPASSGWDMNPLGSSLPFRCRLIPVAPAWGRSELLKSVSQMVTSCRATAKLQRRSCSEGPWATSCVMPMTACVQKPQTCIPSGLTSRKPEAERQQSP